MRSRLGGRRLKCRLAGRRLRCRRVRVEDVGRTRFGAGVVVFPGPDHDGAAVDRHGVAEPSPDAASAAVSSLSTYVAPPSSVRRRPRPVTTITLVGRYDGTVDVHGEAELVARSGVGDVSLASSSYVAPPSVVRDVGRGEHGADQPVLPSIATDLPKRSFDEASAAVSWPLNVHGAAVARAEGVGHTGAALLYCRLATTVPPSIAGAAEVVMRRRAGG